MYRIYYENKEDGYLYIREYCSMELLHKFINETDAIGTFAIFKKDDALVWKKQSPFYDTLFRLLTKGKVIMEDKHCKCGAYISQDSVICLDCITDSIPFAA